jgi:biopolymer transport protein ExbD
MLSKTQITVRERTVTGTGESTRASNTIESMTPRPLFFVGVVTLFVGLLFPFAAQRWLSSRNAEPVNATASVETENIQSISFKINFPGTYWVSVRFHDSARPYSEDCPPRSLPLPRWTVERLPKWYEKHSEPWADSSGGFAWGNGMELNDFKAPSGTYQFDIHFLKGTECLKERHPRVVIWTNDLDVFREVTSLFANVFHYLAALGACCVPLALAIWCRRHFWKELPLRLFPEVIPRNHLRLLRHRPEAPIAQLPNFGLVYGSVLWVLIFLFMIVDEPRHYCGLPIDFRARDSVAWEKSPWQETLSVYLAVGEKYYVNGEPVPRDNLRTRLQQELNKRMVWTVYFEADSDTLNMDAVYAMDAIQGLGAKLVWITPKMREELRQKESAQHQQK